MLTRLLDTVLPAIVLVAMAFMMAISFGGLGADHSSQPLRTVALERVVISAPRELPTVAVAQADAAAATSAVAQR